MPKLYRLPRFHSNLVYQRPCNISNIEALRSIYPNLYYEDEIKQDANKRENEACSVAYYDYTNDSTTEAKRSYVKLQSASLTTGAGASNDAEDFAKGLTEMQDYGSETRDFIISCLEKSLYNKTPQENQPSCSNMESPIDVNDVNLCIGKKGNKTVVRRSLQSSTKSKLPLPVKDHVRRDSPSSRQSVRSKVCNSHKTNVVEKLPTAKHFDKSITRWFVENKLQFTRRMTSYTFAQSDIIGRRGFKQNSHTLFGYTF